jgi:hypothetical protein
MRKRLTFKNWAFHFVKEIIPIVTGILIALFINNWNEIRKDKIYLNKMLASIKSELHDTNARIDSVLPKQRQLIDSLNFYAADKKKNIMDIVLKANGFSIEPIKMNSWVALSSSKIQLIDYNVISTLSEIQNKKENLNMKSDYIVNFIYGNLIENSKEKKLMLTVLIKDLIIVEETIQEEVNKYAGQIEDTLTATDS